MFSYDTNSQSYSFSLLEGDEKPAPDNRTRQDIALRTEFKVIQEPDFHDLWYCEHEFCDNSFWFGGKHHCRLCGITVCADHCIENVVLSTRTMPVTIDKLPNIKNTILAASKTELPETLEFKRACLKCCEAAKVLPKPTLSEEERRRQKDERRARRAAEKKQKEEENHWTKDESLTQKVQAMKAKKEARKAPRHQGEEDNSAAKGEQKNIEDRTTVAVAEVAPASAASTAPAKSPRSAWVSAQSSQEASSESKGPGQDTKPTFAATVAFNRHATKREAPAEVKSTQADSTGRLLVTLKGAGDMKQGDKTIKRTAATDILERAATQLQTAKVVQDAAYMAKVERTSKLTAEESLAEQKLAETLTPAELELYHKQQEVLRAEAERERIEQELEAARAKAGADLAAMMLRRSREAENAAHEAELAAQADAARAVLSDSTLLVFTGVAKLKAFQRAKVGDDYVILAVAAAELIMHRWRTGRAQRLKMQLARQRQALIQNRSARRLQHWLRSEMSRRRAAKAHRLQQNLAAKEVEANTLRRQEKALKRAAAAKLNDLVMSKLVARHRFRRRVSQMPRVLVIDRIAVSASYSSQFVIVTSQDGLTKLHNTQGAQRTAMLQHSTPLTLFKTKENAFASNSVCHERVIVTGVTDKTKLCVTLVNPICFVQVSSAGNTCLFCAVVAFVWDHLCAV